jgi:hypothetical protein
MKMKVVIRSLFVRKWIFRILWERYCRRYPENVRQALGSADRAIRLATVRRIVCLADSLVLSAVPHLTDFMATQDQTAASRERVLQISGSLAAYGDAPLFMAVKEAAMLYDMGLREIEIDRVTSHQVLGRLEKTWYDLADRIGMENEGIELGVTSQALAVQREAQGKQVLFLAQKQPKRLLGVGACMYDVQPEASQAFTGMRRAGYETILVTGHSERLVQGIFTVHPIFDRVLSEFDAGHLSDIVLELAGEAVPTLFVSGTKKRTHLPPNGLGCVVGEGGIGGFGSILPILQAARSGVEWADRRSFGGAHDADKQDKTGKI